MVLYVAIQKLITPRGDIFNFASEDFQKQLASVKTQQQMEQLVDRLSEALAFKPEGAEGEFPTLGDMEFEMVHLANFMKTRMQMHYQSKSIRKIFKTNYRI